MKKPISPASLISIVGGILAVIGLISYFTNTANLSVPTFFYGVPILLIGLALKTSELAPAQNNVSSEAFDKFTQKGPEELAKLIQDVSRHQYGKRAHLESSLKVLKIWDDYDPPQLYEISDFKEGEDYGVSMKFKLCGVALEKWKTKQDRLGRFFAKGLIAEINTNQSNEVELKLIPKQSIKEFEANNDI